MYGNKSRFSKGGKKKIAKDGKKFMGGHFRAVQGFKYLGDRNG